MDPNRQQRNQTAPPPSPRKQVQIRLDESQELAVIAAYRSGLTVYEVGHALVSVAQP